MTAATAFKMDVQTSEAPATHSARILPFRSAANDDEFLRELEIRYGCAFAQWLIDDLKKNGY